jgi:hypothetical protein
MTYTLYDVILTSTMTYCFRKLIASFLRKTFDNCILEKIGRENLSSRYAHQSYHARIERQFKIHNQGDEIETF